MKIKNIKLISFGSGQGFYIPKTLLKGRIEDGLEIGNTYDIEISETKEEVTA